MKAYKETVNRYYKYVMEYLPFNQPSPISSLGGASFGCTGYASGGNQSGSPQAATYPNTGSFYCYQKGGQPGQWYYFYTPSPTKINQVQFSYSWGGRGVYATFYGSNTNGNWTTLASQGHYGDGTSTITFNNDTPYQYYHLYLLTPGGGGADGMNVSGICLYGTEYQQTIEEVTAEDEYDFTVEGGSYYLKKETERKYYKYGTQYTSPNMTSENTPSGTVTLLQGSDYGDRKYPWQMFNSANADDWVHPSSSTYAVRYTFDSPLSAGIGTVSGYYSSDDPKGATTSNRALTAYSITLNFSNGTSQVIKSWSGSTYAVTNITASYEVSEPITSVDISCSGSTWYTFGCLYDFSITHTPILEATSSDYDFYEDVDKHYAARSFAKGEYIPTIFSTYLPTPSNNGGSS